MGMALRAPGTAVYGLLYAGTYYFLHTGKVFIDAHYPFQNLLQIVLEHEDYRCVIVEVEDAQRAVTTIREAIAASPS
jgi:hypothetical protein